MTLPKLFQILPLLAALLISGCATSAVQRHPASPKVQLANVYRPPVGGGLSRVAVLPISGDVQPADALREMDQTFFSEFNKTQVFEGVKVNRPFMAESIHQEQLPSTEPVPREFLLTLQQRYSAEAVLFVDITHYRPYRPISISVRTKLVSLKTNDVLWAIDSTFDSAEPAVAAAARTYSKLTEQESGHPQSVGFLGGAFESATVRAFRGARGVRHFAQENRAPVSGTASLFEAAVATHPEKAALLCAHAQDLSTQCTIAFRHGGMDSLLDLQTRKHTIIQELAALMRDLDPTNFPALHEAVERLRGALREEARIFAAGSKIVQNELLSVCAAQRRLTQARRYDTAGEALPVGGGHLSICG